VAFRPAGANFAVFASNQGRSAHPDWFRNLLAHPITSGRSAIWEAWKAEVPPFAEDEKTAAPREIPVVILERA
jgi:hypothetical protein